MKLRWWKRKAEWPSGVMLQPLGTRIVVDTDFGSDADDIFDLAPAVRYHFMNPPPRVWTSGWSVPGTADLSEPQEPPTWRVLTPEEIEQSTARMHGATLKPEDCICGGLDPNNTTGIRRDILCPACDGYAPPPGFDSEGH